MKNITGKVIYITGATHGIGKALALRFSKDNVKLALCGRDENALGEIGNLVMDNGSCKPYIKAFDLENENEIVEFYKQAREKIGIPHILVNNAGFNTRKAYLWEYGIEEFDKMISVNLRAPFVLSKLAFLDMKEKKDGHILNVLSTACHFANEKMSIYTATKKGFEGLTDVFRKEARLFNIRVTSVYPGGVDTKFRKGARPDYMKPESVAEAIYKVLTMPDDLIVHGITFRPMIEINF